VYSYPYHRCVFLPVLRLRPGPVQLRKYFFSCDNSRTLEREDVGVAVPSMTPGRSLGHFLEVGSLEVRKVVRKAPSMRDLVEDRLTDVFDQIFASCALEPTGTPRFPP